MRRTSGRDIGEAAGSPSPSHGNRQEIPLTFSISAGSGLTWQHEDEVFVREGAQFEPTSRRSADRRQFNDLPIPDGIVERALIRSTPDLGRNATGVRTNFSMTYFVGVMTY
jgi:hypothetical protein